MCKYFSWETLKSKVCCNNNQSLQQLQQNISGETTANQEVQLRSVFRNLLTRGQEMSTSDDDVVSMTRPNQTVPWAQNDCSGNMFNIIHTEACWRKQDPYFL
ncbi:hypothetical protein TNCV_2129811 [Trichonephila clavipes]|nr:hypothetical protein TNCV_2129811 [Trichonephila clavipes]